MLEEEPRTGFPIRGFVRYFDYLRFTRIVTVIPTAIAIVTVSVMVNIRCLLSVQMQIDRPGANRAGRRLGRQERPSPHIQRKFQLR